MLDLKDWAYLMNLAFPMLVPRGVLAPDPLNGNKMALMYTLPVNVTAGDLTILEPQGSIDDLLRFENGNQLFFYSGNTDGSDSLADVGIPATFQTNIVQIPENLGVEGNNAATWTPLMGNPGFGGISRYVFVSDSTPVPEPRIGLIALGALLLVCRHFWRARGGSHVET